MDETTGRTPGRRKAAAETSLPARTRGKQSRTAPGEIAAEITMPATEKVGKQTAVDPSPKRKVRSMGDEHKSAIQSGRAQTKVVREYLEALENRRPRRERRPDPAKMRARIERVEAELAAAEPLERVTLHQERMDLERQIDALEQGDRLEELEEGFVAVVGEYSRRHGISAEAWLAVGVPKGVLRRGGVA